MRALISKVGVVDSNANLCNFMVTGQKQEERSLIECSGMESQNLILKNENNKNLSVHEVFPVVKEVDVSTSRAVSGLDPQHHSAITFKNSVTPYAINQSKVNPSNISLCSNPKMANLGKNFKGDGIKINSYIHKGIHNKVRKVKSSKNQKVTVQDFVSHLASNLDNHTMGMSLDNVDPNIVQNKMDELPNL